MRRLSPMWQMWSVARKQSGVLSMLGYPELPLFRKEFLAADILQSVENSCVENKYVRGMPISSVPTR